MIPLQLNLCAECLFNLLMCFSHACSNLSVLIKLHLEQNELTGFLDQMLFCDLPSLMDLHLGDNLLRGLHFNITCLHHLRYLDLRRNRIARLSKSDLAMLDTFPARGQPLTVDLVGNPLCDCTVSINKASFQLICAFLCYAYI